MIGVICGIRFEAQILKEFDILTEIGAGRREVTERAAARLLDSGANALASFGTAGGIQRGLRTGDVIVGGEVVTASGESWASDARLSAALANALAPCQMGRVLGVDAPILSAGDKARAFARTGAMAVDMESHVVARFAVSKKVPFSVVRTVLDDVDESVPPVLGGAVDQRGGIDFLAIARGVLTGDVSIATLMNLRRQMAVARPSLFRCGAAIARFGH